MTLVAIDTFLQMKEGFYSNTSLRFVLLLHALKERQSVLHSNISHSLLRIDLFSRLNGKIVFS